MKRSFDPKSFATFDVAIPSVIARTESGNTHVIGFGILRDDEVLIKSRQSELSLGTGRLKLE
jgi:hypothetical protein